jgi:hypothetical protein
VRKFLLLFSLAFSLAAQAQNLVPNYSFEQYDTCPNLGDQIQYATGWSKYSALITTPDYYNACSPSNQVGVPQNFWGYRTEHRGCSAFAGIATYSITAGYREVIGIRLSQPLIIGQQYFISFYTVFGEIHSGNFYSTMPSNNIGMRLSTVAYSPSNPVPIDNFAHLHSTAIISDSINWNLISGSIIADSAFDYLIIGNFYSDINTDTLNYNCPTCLNNFSYYYIDDVCVSTDSLLCNGGIAELPCVTSVNEISTSDGINLFPNPASENLTIESTVSFEKKYLTIYNAFGSEVLKQNFSSERHSVDISGWAEGIYIAEIRNEKGIVRKQFIKK